MEVPFGRVSFDLFQTNTSLPEIPIEDDLPKIALTKKTARPLESSQGIQINVSVERQAVPSSVSMDIVALISFVAPPQPEGKEEERAPLDLVAVIDVEYVSGWREN